MRCETHCPPGHGGSALPALVALVTVAVASQVVTSIAEAFALAVFAACAVSLVILVRLHWPARARRAAPVPARVVVRAEVVRQVKGAPLMLEAPRAAATIVPADSPAWTPRRS